MEGVSSSVMSIAHPAIMLRGENPPSSTWHLATLHHGHLPQKIRPRRCSLFHGPLHPNRPDVPSCPGVPPRAMNFPEFALAFILWEVLDVLLRVFLARYVESAHFKRICPVAKDRAVIKSCGPAYLKSTLHALIVSARGWRHLYVLRRAPAVAKLQLLSDASHPIYRAQPELLPESVSALSTNIILGAYLMSDLIHVLPVYPTLGGMDTIAHHVAFFSCAIIAGGNRMVPFMFGWLIVGECSTPALNLRWFFIKTGNGGHRAFKYVQLAFVVLFVMARLFIYGAGLGHQLYLLWIGTPILVPMWAMVVVMGLVVVGFVINLVWLSKIGRVLRKSKMRFSVNAETEDTSNDVGVNGVAEEGKTQ